MSLLVAAPDKFRGTATAAQVAAAASRAARRHGWSCDEVPLSDGGEGLLQAAGGASRRTVVRGPLGRPVEAEWRWLEGPPGGRVAGGDGGRVWPTAVIEMAQAAGRSLVPDPVGDQPLRATTAGVGQLVVAAVEAGARRVIVGCGGSATTDGGIGALLAVGGALARSGASLVVAADVATPFTQAARVFGPQKGATPDQVRRLTARLSRAAAAYRRHFGVEVDALAGSGAAGGLAGALAALGGRIVPGFDLVAAMVDLPRRLARADLVVTGEGRLDATSFAGKVVGGVVAQAAWRAPVLCVAGEVAPGACDRLPPHVTVVSLVERFGPGRSRLETSALVEQVVSDYLDALGRPAST